MRISSVYLLMVCSPLEDRRSDVLAVFSDKLESERVAELVRTSHTFEGMTLVIDDDSDVFVTSRLFFDYAH